MSDASVHAALRSDAPLVVVEAPAGCGKTHQGADYAGEIGCVNGSGRPLILTHTHAACSVFSDRTKGTRARVDIRTIDSVILMPCDARTFPDKLEARCLLYVALSRARSRLQLVVSRNSPSPLLAI